MSQLDIIEINEACERRSLLNPIRWLLRIGFVRPHHNDPVNRVRWPLHVQPSWLWFNPYVTDPIFGMFRCYDTASDVGTWLPRRWGVRFWIFEFGQRG
jgi:hypothetical protein